MVARPVIAPSAVKRIFRHMHGARCARSPNLERGASGTGCVGSAMVRDNPADQAHRFYSHAKMAPPIPPSTSPYNPPTMT